MSSPSVRHSDVDACPGALRLHTAADGPLARVRLPGGLLTGEQVRALATIAHRWGDGQVELTSRANVQLRALTGAPADELAAALRGAGLLPSETHELVRNIAAVPTAGGWEVRPLVHALDAAVCSEPALAGLPGRFLFALGPVPAAADLAAVETPEGAAILFGGRDEGLRVPPGAVVDALIAGALSFLAVRAERSVPAWRLRELANGPAEVAARTAARLGVALQPPGPSTGTPGPPPGPPPGSGQLPPVASQPPPRAGELPRVTSQPPPGPERLPADPSQPPRGPVLLPVAAEPIGVVEQAGGRFAAAALAPLGLLRQAQLAALAEAGELAVTPWRGVIVLDQSRAEAAAWLGVLAEVGLEVSPGSRWSGVTACAGRPGCAKALADVRHDADAATTFGAGLPVHWVGCARGCGSPAGAHVRVEATGDGYAVTGPSGGGTATASDVGALVTTARRA
ncbi:precorrin-3B synthase [Actinoplanes sp. NPDC049265]|uniref:precorrin-3B synthase n=1 Tax=Actinoplanes sp. NPDC049265 TaxID=3363902 RepID=UPI003721941E